MEEARVDLRAGHGQGLQAPPLQQERGQVAWALAHLDQVLAVRIQAVPADLHIHLGQWVASERHWELKPAYAVPAHN